MTDTIEQQQQPQEPGSVSASNSSDLLNTIFKPKYSGFDCVTYTGEALSVYALKQAYRKHVAGDDSIGWDELSDTLGNALAQIMGDEEFCEWSDGI